jgi:hypothetical protein
MMQYDHHHRKKKFTNISIFLCLLEMIEKVICYLPFCNTVQYIQLIRHIIERCTHENLNISEVWKKLRWMYHGAKRFSYFDKHLSNYMYKFSGRKKCRKKRILLRWNNQPVRCYVRLLTWIEPTMDPICPACIIFFFRLITLFSYVWIISTAFDFDCRWAHKLIRTYKCWSRLIQMFECVLCMYQFSLVWNSGYKDVFDIFWIHPNNAEIKNFDRVCSRVLGVCMSWVSVMLLPISLIHTLNKNPQVFCY